MALLPVAEALSRILDGARPGPTQSVPLLEAGGRVLAEAVGARMTQPPFDASAMDGYAVRADDVTTLPATLKLVGEAAAGRAFKGAVGPGEAVRIFTGAPVPSGADAIVIQENTRAEGGVISVLDGRPDAAHIRPRGGDFAEGEALLARGTVLGARTVTLAAAMGHATLPVVTNPKVAIIATGDELVMPGVTPSTAQIVCSNPFGIAAMVAAAGGTPVFLGIAPDDKEAIARKIEAASGADVIVTIGGASVGDHDLVAPALQSKGMSLDFWKIAMRPGKPLMFGRLGESRVIGLPGNPVSSLICTRVFIVPLVRRLAGHAGEAAHEARAVLSEQLERNGPREHYMRARRAMAEPGRRPLVTPIPNQDSALLSPLAAADCLIVRPAGAPAQDAGTEVSVLPLDF